MFEFTRKSLAALGLVAAVTVVNATPVNLSGSEANLQAVINNLYSCGICSPVANAPDVNTDQYTPDEVWAINSGSIASAQLLIEIAGNANFNTFGIYNPFSPSTSNELFSGSATPTVGFSKSIAINAAGDLYVDAILAAGGAYSERAFGFYLGTPNGTFYSEAWRNPGGVDQMVAFRGDGDTISLPFFGTGVWDSSNYILAWEDLLVGPGGPGDEDYQDMVIHVSNVRSVNVPEPATLGLLGLGLLGVGFARRRKAS